METTQTVSAIAIARLRLDFQSELLAAIEQGSGFLGGIDDFNPYGIGLWIYDEPEHIAGCDTELRRTCALEWLRAHARLIQRVGRLMGNNLPMQKQSSDFGFGVQLTIRRDRYVSETLIATVPSDLTCEMVPTGEVEHIPARDVPVMERRCPESIFRGIEAEVEV